MTSWVLDLDGVVWLADEPIPGSVDAVRSLVDRGDSVVLVSNNSSLSLQEYQSKLKGMGLPAEADLVTSAMAAATLLAPSERVLVCGGPGLAEAVRQRGAIALANDADHVGVDAVAVGFHREFDYARLRRAATAVRRGARLVATNDDATYPTPEGPIPGAGSLLAAVETATGKSATVAGKPNAAIVELVRPRIGSGGVVVGDRPDTDGRFARALGARFALVLSGVTKDPTGCSPTPDTVAPDLAALVRQLA